MQTITPKDNIDDVKTDPLKPARDKYYANNRHILREKQKNITTKLKSQMISNKGNEQITNSTVTNIKQTSPRQHQAEDLGHIFLIFLKRL